MPSFFNNTPPEEPEYTLFVLEETEPAPDDALPEVQPEAPRTFGQKLLDMFVPMRGDDVSSIIRKIVAIIAVIALLVAMGYLAYELWIMPLQNEAKSAAISKLYDPDNTVEFPQEVEDYGQYPEGMNPAFKALYYTNNDVRGWLTFNSTSKYWYGIDYPVVQAADNDYYLYRDFYKENNKNGTLFFDARNDFSSADATNRVSIIYGHNMISGQMLASLNKLLDSVGMARSAPTLTMNTLYEDATYKVFAVFIWDNAQRDFNYMQMTFADDADFMDYVARIRERSWYDYQDVDVNPGDELLVLSTCSNKSQTHLEDGRTIVVARKVREGESTSVNTAHIVANSDALQPLAWYEAEGLTLPDYYNGATTTTTTGKTATTTTTTTTGADGSTTSESGSSSTTTTTTTTKGGGTAGKPTTTTTKAGTGTAKPTTTTVKKDDNTTTTTTTVADNTGSSDTPSSDNTPSSETTTTTAATAIDPPPSDTNSSSETDTTGTDTTEE